MKRSASKPAPEAARLSRDSIIDEGIRLLGEEGLDGVSLRNLAARLGVRAPSLYWHVPDKATLLAGMMERLFTQCVERVPAKANWQDWMREFGAVLWHTQNSVRDWGRLFTTSPMGEEQIARTTDLLARRMAGLDLSPKDAMRIQSSVQVLITGWSIFANTTFAHFLHWDFRSRALHDLDLLLEGEAKRLTSVVAGRGRRRSRP